MDGALIIRLSGFTTDDVYAGESALSQPLLIATSNAGKLRELRSLLVNLPFVLLSLTDFPNIESVEETGSTFAENAALKATGYARQARVLTLADDSGLVDALSGRPGVHSARYVRPDATYPERIPLLLAELEKTADCHRAARFVCSMAVAADPGAVIFATEKSCAGRIEKAPRGIGGFGYDPIFVPDGFDQTFAELTGETKNRISHRALALAAVREFLVSLTGLRSDG
jgi:non-canonical purine NTP pyrophosphatase (RdgB/HAM1 family)